MNFLNPDTIIACSSASQVNSAISVIRVSGFKSLEEINCFFSVDLNKIKNRQAFLSEIRDGDKLLDKAIVTYFKNPKSYTGENLLEISVHGNTINISRIIEAFNKKNIRLALPGEFTYRALKNKKMTLSQVEGLEVFLNANSEFALDQGLKILHGELFKEFTNLKDMFVNLKASVELNIDFSQDIGEKQAHLQLKDNFNLFFDQVKNLKNKIIKDSDNLFSPKIIIMGQTNSGKSTLFNHMLKQRRAIVSSEEGTTRDYISSFFDIDKVKYQLIDTAGFRDTENEIEIHGMSSAISLFSKSFFKILVINPLNFKKENIKSILNYEFDLLVVTHVDKIEDKSTLSKINYPFICHQTLFVGMNKEYCYAPIRPLSNLCGSIEPQDFIWKCISNKFRQLYDIDPIFVPRHKRLIEDIYKKAEQIRGVIFYENDIGIISSEINLIGDIIYELFGIVSPDYILKGIFSNFCIGK